MSSTDQINTPAKAFDLHTSFVEYRANHPRTDWNVHLGYYVASRSVRGTIDRFSLDRDDLEAAEVYHDVTRTLDDAILTRADTVYLADDLRTLVTTAEATMPDEVLFETDIYTPCGFVVMETPIAQDIPARLRKDDLDDLIASAHALGGSVTGTRLYGEGDKDTYIGTDHWLIRAFAWADMEAFSDDALNDISTRFGEGSPEHVLARDVMLNYTGDARGIFVRVYGQTFGSTVDGLTFSIPRRAELAPLRLLNQYAFFFGEDGLAFETTLHDEVRSSLVAGATPDEFDLPALVKMHDASQSQAHAVRRFMLALFRLMDEYVEVESTRLHRAHGRRATRGGRIGDVKNVTVLSLRRALYGDDESGASGRKITMAHLVRGHWRRQWYPSQQMHRAKWIRAHRRGGNGTEEIAERPRIITVDR